jgi:hypothetical protein
MGLQKKIRLACSILSRTLNGCRNLELKKKVDPTTIVSCRNGARKSKDRGAGVEERKPHWDLGALRQEFRSQQPAALTTTTPCPQSSTSTFHRHVHSDCSSAHPFAAELVMFMECEPVEFSRKKITYTLK